MSLPHLSAADVLGAVSPAQAVGIIGQALLDGLDPAADPDRSVVPLRSGQALLMPAEFGDRAGVKLAMVAPANPALGLPRIQGTYVLFDAHTLTPLVTMDGPALTELRTPAVTVAALAPVLRRERQPIRVAVVGRGPQARGHVRTLTDFLDGVRPLEAMTVLSRREHLDTVRLSTPAADEVLSAAHLVVCATTAGEPVFDSTLLRRDVVVAAVGSHEPDRRELDGTLLQGAQVVVEDLATAMREAGDVVMAVAEGKLRESDLVTMSDVVSGRVVLNPGRPVVFKGTGMSWQDLVLADVVHRRHVDPG